VCEQIGKLIQDLKATQDIGRLATYIGNLLPGSSKFFLIYIIMRTFMTVPLRFLITQPGVWQSWLRWEGGGGEGEGEGGGGKDAWCSTGKEEG
jgi:hypothetical protein